MRRRLQAPDHAVWRQHAWKREDIRDDQKRRKEISTRDHENGAGAQNGKLSVQEDRRDRIGHEHRGRIDRDEGVDRAQLDATERPDHEVQGDDQPEHDTESEALLPGSRGQVREDERLVLAGTRGASHASKRLLACPLDESILRPRQYWRRATEQYTASPCRRTTWRRDTQRHPEGIDQRLWTSACEWRILFVSEPARPCRVCRG